MNQYDEVIEQYKLKPDELAMKSRSWFVQQTKLLESKTTLQKSVLGNSDLITVKSLKPGSMYFFKYMPQGVNELPHYDIYPLVFPFSATKTGFHALNFHYLHPYHRAKLLGSIMHFSSSKTMDENTKAKFSWDMINRVAQHKITKHAVKQYLYSHIRSQVKMIHPEHWTSTVILPLESFRGASKSSIWAI